MWGHGSVRCGAEFRCLWGMIPMKWGGRVSAGPTRLSASCWGTIPDMWGMIPLTSDFCPTSQRNRAPHQNGILPHFKRNQCPTWTGILSSSTAEGGTLYYGVGMVAGVSFECPLSLLPLTAVTT